MMRLADQAKLARAEIVSEICRNQIVRSPANADVHLCGGGAYQGTAFSASSRDFDLNGEARTARTKQNSPIIPPA